MTAPATLVPAPAQLAGVPSVATMRAHIQQLADQRDVVAQFIKEHFTDRVDYGTLPGTDKLTLYKPGAERVTDLFQCVARPEILHQEIDWERGFFAFEVKVRITPRDRDDVLIAEGLGACNSKEAHYRRRNAQRKCPECGAETIFASKDKSTGDQNGWFCGKKKGGCGRNFNLEDPQITEQETGQVENADPWDLHHTILVMAEKRAHVAAAYGLVRYTKLFDQPVGKPSAKAAQTQAKPPLQLVVDQLLACKTPEEASRLGGEIHDVWEMGGQIYKKLEAKAAAARPAAAAPAGGQAAPSSAAPKKAPDAPATPTSPPPPDDIGF